MNFEQAMIVIHAPQHFPTLVQFRAAGFIIDDPFCPPHIKTDRDANVRRAKAVRKQAFDAMVDGRF